MSDQTVKREPALPEGWLPVVDAPFLNAIQLLVEHTPGGERRVFVASATSKTYSDCVVWFITTDALMGWGPLRSDWTPLGWKPLTPAPPKT